MSQTRGFHSPRHRHNLYKHPEPSSGSTLAQPVCVRRAQAYGPSCREGDIWVVGEGRNLVEKPDIIAGACLRVSARVAAKQDWVPMRRV
eukprot:1087829-Pyramimonas_sp.AAC.2